ncbi:phosphatidylserine decarboxylase [Hydrogenimonas urashimensis]|uniref:phosphatidylserine decarboxylase n=1 Tax=Hydrogenimonas urashimensis TaxID=2740515 RepID=UPI001915B778|nr:phosphatidylserine decarboxylase [Hydrogenimonas urashimensis]
MVKKHLTNVVSQWFGRFADHEFPSNIQSFINHAYVNLLGLDMSEFAPPSTYPTLNKLFTRELRKERSIDYRHGVLISPVDAFVTECGRLQKDKALQIKGMEYSIDDLLTLQYGREAKALYEGTYINFYLSPKDYHRYHMPYKLRIASILHQPGKLYPVNFPSLRRTKELFVENERVILECFTEKNRRIFIVLVGALNVGRMTIAFDHRIKTNADPYEPTFYRYDKKPVWIHKGDLLGMFMMGSTVLIFAEPGLMEIRTNDRRHVRFGERVAIIRD